MAPKQKKQTKKQRAELIARSILLAPGQVMLPSVPPINERTRFIAAGGGTAKGQSSPLLKVCRSTAVPLTCFAGKGGKGAKKLTGKKLGLSRPTAAEYTAACKRVKGTLRQPYMKSIRADKIELDFLSPAQAKALGTRSGPNLRLCLRDDTAGHLIPVDDPEMAAKIAAEFKVKTKGRKKNMPAVALQLSQKYTGKKSPPLGEFTSGTFSHLFSRGR